MELKRNKQMLQGFDNFTEDDSRNFQCLGGCKIYKNKCFSHPIFRCLDNPTFDIFLYGLHCSILSKNFSQMSQLYTCEFHLGGRRRLKKRD